MVGRDIASMESGVTCSTSRVEGSEDDDQFLSWLMVQVDRSQLSLKTAIACAYRRGRAAGIEAALAKTTV